MCTLRVHHTCKNIPTQFRHWLGSVGRWHYPGILFQTLRGLKLFYFSHNVPFHIWNIHKNHVSWSGNVSVVGSLTLTTWDHGHVTWSVPGPLHRVIDLHYLLVTQCNYQTFNSILITVWNYTLIRPIIHNRETYYKFFWIIQTNN